MIRTRCLAIACVFFAIAARADAQPVKRPITLEDLWKVKRLGKPSISPDGKWVAVDVTTFSMEENNSNTQIWLCSTDSKTQKQLTNHKASSSGPLFSPDGKSIAFTRKLPSPLAGEGSGGGGGEGGGRPRSTSSPPTAARPGKSRRCR